MRTGHKARFLLPQTSLGVRLPRSASVSRVPTPRWRRKGRTAQAKMEEVGRRDGELSMLPHDDGARGRGPGGDEDRRDAGRA